ncbi:hypothetical protein WJX72_011855 [[Myrmecia] bisecta]|uniref:Helicase-associated domain-containing protein n=1 Tax=[Myrmecia] bisecta TaxID=41462 RepID=A0AAW1PTX2_9CHLO
MLNFHQQQPYDFTHFEAFLGQLRRYQAAWGDCLVPKRLWDNRGLGEWVADMRLMGREGWLASDKLKALQDVGFAFKQTPAEALWSFNLHELRRYKEEHGSIEVPFKWRDPTGDFGNEFAKWFHAQPTLFRQRRLAPEQVDKLQLVGYNLREVTGDDISADDYAAAHGELAGDRKRNEFLMMFEELKAWKQRYYTAVVPRQVHDNPVLGEWTIRTRKAYKEGLLHEWQEELLDSIEFPWKVDQLSAKWHSNLHHARRYKEIHGHANLPPDFYDPDDPDFVEAARWIARQDKLYQKQKLSERRLLILQDVLGLKFRRPYSPVRKNIHLHIQDDTVAPHERPYQIPSPNPNKHKDVRRKAERRRMLADRA